MTPTETPLPLKVIPPDAGGAWWWFGQLAKLKAGADETHGRYLVAPRGVQHRLRAGASGARLLFLFTPGGFERLIEATSVVAPEPTIPPPDVTPPDDAAAITRRYGTEILDCLPGAIAMNTTIALNARRPCGAPSAARWSPSAERRKVRFDSGGTTYAAWHYPGINGACVIMAGGLAVTKEPGTDRFAKRFHEAGFTVLAFDYRHFGESAGQPRQIARIGEQHADLQAAIDFARTLPGVDPSRLASRNPLLVPLAGEPRTVTSLPTPDSLNGAEALNPDNRYPQWQQEVAARSALRVGFYRPGRFAPRVKCPLLVLAYDQDGAALPGPALRAAQRAPRGELVPARRALRGVRGRPRGGHRNPAVLPASAAARRVAR